MSILEIETLSKKFGGHNVINNLSLSVPENTIYGFLGQNGAGKTTTMKMILGLLKPTSGKISVCGEAVTYGEPKTNRYIGFLPDVPEFYGDMKPKAYLALLSEPKLLICDEPTSALDPIGRKEILDILLSVKGKTTVVFSTHILSDVERICDHVAVLNNGSLVLNGTLSQLKQNHRLDTLQIEFRSPEDLQRFAGNECVGMLFQNAERTDCTVILRAKNSDEAAGQIYDAIYKTKIYPVKVEILEPTLENLFLEVVK